MTIAVITDTTCTNVCEFADLKTALSFFAANVWEGATQVVELPEGYGIGDTLTDGVWAHKAAESTTDEETDRITALEEENKSLTAKMSAASTQITMLEDCIIEMAQTVYA